MSSAQERVRARLEASGFHASDDEVRDIAASYPTLRDQVDAVNRAASGGAITDMLTRSDFPPSGSVENVVTGEGPVVTIRDAAKAVREGSTTSVDLVGRMLARVDTHDAALGAFVQTFHETALEAAERADQELASGSDRGPLHGIPIAIKDVIGTVEGTTRANSRVPIPNWVNGRDAAAVARLRAAGAVILGKTTTNEFALGVNEPGPDFPMPHNPWNTSRYAGGSSSGNGIAVAAGFALGAIGTDTAGSVRHPSALNGITGLKPTFGRVPITGVVPLAPSLDTVGPMARSAWDCGLLLQAMAHAGVGDGGAQPLPEYSLAMNGHVRGIRIGVPKHYFFDEGNVEDGVRLGVENAIHLLKESGATLVEVRLPSVDVAKMANHIVLLAEAFACHRESLGTHGTEYGSPLRGLLARGALFDERDYAHAKRVGAIFAREVENAMTSCDVLAMPTMPTGARLLDETDPAMMDRWSRASFIGQWNLTGLPACALPVGFDERAMPVSMQLVGKLFDEATVLRVADAFQRVTRFHLVAPGRPRT